MVDAVVLVSSLAMLRGRGVLTTVADALVAAVRMWGQMGASTFLTNIPHRYHIIVCASRTVGRLANTVECDTWNARTGGHITAVGGH
jgi:hypothetical protein